MKTANYDVKPPKLDRRGAGIMLPISALSSRHGIGTFGEAAHQFLRELKSAGQQYWQVLPLFVIRRLYWEFLRITVGLSR